MRSKRYLRDPLIVAAVAASVAGLGATSTSAQAPEAETMWNIIQEQAAKIHQLEARLEGTDEKVEATSRAVEETQVAVEATALAVEEGTAGPGWWERTSLGGYGELHYEGGEKKKIDFHRFVLLIGHEFNDRIRLHSELELEHALAGDGKNGEVEVEQAYVELDLDERNRLQAGLWLIPVGILNETHEPSTFYGVERNNVEKNIIPTTWWGGGVGLAGNFENGIGYNLAFHSGLKTPVTGKDAFKIRKGRQKVSEADAEDFAYTGRLSYSGLPGVEFAGTFQYQSDLTQGLDRTDATLTEVHVDGSYQGFGLRALYARWNLDSDSGVAEDMGRDVQEGWYVEPSYRFAAGDFGDLGVFFRVGQFDNEAGDSADSETGEYSFGVNYWPHPNVVFKADFLVEDTPEGTDADDRLNLGVGYQF